MTDKICVLLHIEVIINSGMDAVLLENWFVYTCMFEREWTCAYLRYLLILGNFLINLIQHSLYFSRHCPA